MTTNDSTTIHALRQQFQDEADRIARAGAGNVGAGLSDFEARREFNKLELRAIRNAKRLRDGVLELVESVYPDQGPALASYLQARFANAQPPNVGEFWLDVLAEIEDGTLLGDAAGDSDYQARLALQQLIVEAVELVRAQCGDEADARLDEICARLDDPNVPDTVEATTEFWRGVIAEIKPRPASLYDLARDLIETGKTQWSAGESVAIWRGASHSAVVTEGGRDGGGLLYLEMRNGKPGQVVRVQVGHLSPRKGWQFSLTRPEYERWAARTRREFKIA